MNDQESEKYDVGAIGFWAWVKRFSLAIGIVLTGLNIAWFAVKYDQFSRAVKGAEPAFDIDYYEMVGDIDLLNGKYGNGILQNKILQYWSDTAGSEIDLRSSTVNRVSD